VALYQVSYLYLFLPTEQLQPTGHVLATFSLYVAYLTAALLACRLKLQPRPKSDPTLNTLQYILQVGCQLALVVKMSLSFGRSVLA